MTINAPRTDPMTAIQKSGMMNTVKDLIDDAELLVSIVLKGLTSQAVDLETGLVTRTADADTVNALRRLVTAEEVTNAGGQLEPNDRVYMFEQSDITSDVQTVDRVVEGTEVLEVIEFGADPLNQVWLLTARLV